MADQCYQIRNVAHITTDSCSVIQLAEIAYIRAFVYRSQLILVGATPGDYHVQYNQVDQVDTQTHDAEWTGYQTDTNWNAHRDSSRTYLQDNLDHLLWLTKPPSK